LEILNISLEKGAIFPDILRPLMRQLIVWRGNNLYINGKSYSPLKDNKPLLVSPKKVPQLVFGRERLQILDYLDNGKKKYPFRVLFATSLSNHLWAETIRFC